MPGWENGIVQQLPQPCALVATPNLWERMLQPCLALSISVLGTQSPLHPAGMGECANPGKIC